MAVEVSWYVPDFILVMKASGAVTVEEFAAGLDEAFGLLEKAEHPIHAILDTQALERLPKAQLNRLPGAIRNLRHPNYGWTCVIGINPGVAFWLKVFLKLFNLRYATFESYEEAEHFVRELERIQAATQAE